MSEEVIQNNINFGPDLLGGDGSKITDPETFLERKERKRLRILIENYKDTYMEIKTGGAYPAYRIAPKKLPLLEEEIKSLLREGIVQLSNSLWTFPAILVPKFGGAVRLCIEYRKLNKVTIPDNIPIPPLIEDVIDWLGQSKIMSGLDLAKGY